MFTADFVINAYNRNLVLLKQMAGDYSHAESVIQPPVKSNCANWIVGHIVVYRNRIMELLGAPLVVDPALTQRYGNGSAPVLGDEPSISQFGDLIAALEVAQERIAAGLGTVTAEQGEEVLTYGSFTLSRAEWMIFLLRHEGYHVGQLELLREVVRG